MFLVSSGNFNCSKNKSFVCENLIEKVDKDEKIVSLKYLTGFKL